MNLNQSQCLHPTNFNQGQLGFDVTHSLSPYLRGLSLEDHQIPEHPQPPARDVKFDALKMFYEHQDKCYNAEVARIQRGPGQQRAKDGKISKIYKDRAEMQLKAYTTFMKEAPRRKNLSNQKNLAIITKTTIVKYFSTAD